MPVHKAGKDKYQWGSQKVYSGPGAKQKALKQAAAIYANGYRGDGRPGPEQDVGESETVYESLYR